VIGENEEIGGIGGERFDAEDRFLKKGFGRDKLEEMFGFRFTAQGPESFPAAAGHDEEEERRHGNEIKMKMRTKGAGNIWGLVGPVIPIPSRQQTFLRLRSDLIGWARVGLRGPNGPCSRVE